MAEDNAYCSDNFAVLDERAYCRTLFADRGLEMNPTLFDINGPFMMGSQFEAASKDNRRIRKRKRPHTDGHHLEKIADHIRSLLPRILAAGRGLGFFKAAVIKDNNHRAREAASEIVPSTSGTGDVNGIIDLSNHDFIQLRMSGGWYRNNTNEVIGISVGDSVTTRQCYVPAGSTFCCGDVAHINNFLPETEPRFDLLCMDPPWENKSAKRTAGYILSDATVKQISMKILALDGVCCMWITNRKGILEEALDIFEYWGLTLVSTWYWLKVTSEGHPVVEFNLSHKVPFEVLLIACRPNSLDMWKSRLPDKFVFASIPMAVHSRKPPVQMFLSHFGVKFRRGCELFARSLLPNTVSVGYEPLYLQTTQVIKPIP